MFKSILKWGLIVISSGLVRDHPLGALASVKVVYYRYREIISRYREISGVELPHLAFTIISWLQSFRPGLSRSAPSPFTSMQGWGQFNSGIGIAAQFQFQFQNWNWNWNWNWWNWKWNWNWKPWNWNWNWNWNWKLELNFFATATAAITS